MHDSNKSQMYPTDDYSNHGYNQAANKIHITGQLMKNHEVYFMGNKFTFKKTAILSKLCCFLYIIIRKRNEIFRIVLQGLRTKQYG